MFRAVTVTMHKVLFNHLSRAATRGAWIAIAAWFAAFGIAQFAGVSPVFAQAVPAAVVVPEEVAFYLREGVALRTQGRDREALVRFEEALRQAPTLGRVHAQIGLAQFALGEWLIAEGHLQTALGSDDPWIARNRASLETSLVEVAAHLGDIEVEVHPSDAEVSIDSEPFERRTRFRVDTGPHTVSARSPGGGTPSTARVDVAAESTTHVVLTLAPPPPQRTPTPAEDPSPHPLIWIGTVTTLAAAAALVPTYVLALDRERALSSQYGTQCGDPAGCPELHRALVSQLDPYAWATNVLWACSRRVVF